MEKKRPTLSLLGDSFKGKRQKIDPLFHSISIYALYLKIRLFSAASVLHFLSQKSVHSALTLMPGTRNTHNIMYGIISRRKSRILFN